MNLHRVFISIGILLSSLALSAQVTDECARLQQDKGYPSYYCDCKENYTDYLQNCFAEVKLDANSEKGYYPLTKDMMRVLQNGFSQWWDATSPNYLEGFAAANKEYAWLFACCYVE